MMNKQQLKKYNKQLIKALEGDKPKKKVKTSDLFEKPKPNKKKKKKSK